MNLVENYMVLKFKCCMMYLILIYPHFEKGGIYWVGVVRHSVCLSIIISFLLNIFRIN